MKKSKKVETVRVRVECNFPKGLWDALPDAVCTRGFLINGGMIEMDSLAMAGFLMMRFGEIVETETVGKAGE